MDLHEPTVSPDDGIPDVMSDLHEPTTPSDDGIPDVVSDVLSPYYQPMCSQFDDEHPKMHRRFNTNRNHVEGKRWKDTVVSFIMRIVLIIILLVFVAVLMNGSWKWYTLGLVCVTAPFVLASGVNAIYEFKKNPIVAVYAVSEMVATANQERFSPVVDVHSPKYIAHSAVMDLEENYTMIRKEVETIIENRDQLSLYPGHL